MACTATATKSDKAEVLKSLEMGGCIEVSASPDRPNIFYAVKVRTDFETDFNELLSSLRTNAVATPRAIVYCISIPMCAELFAHFNYELGEYSYYPRGSPHESQHRLFGMYHAGTPERNKEIILKSLLASDGVVRVVFATIALGMGVNVRDVNTVIHYGAPHSLEDYFQESGRGGRSGDDAVSTVFWKPKDCPVSKQPTTLRDHECIAVRRYVTNTTVCRRKWLLDHFDVKPMGQLGRCCDVCSGTAMAVNVEDIWSEDDFEDLEDMDWEMTV